MIKRIVFTAAAIIWMAIIFMFSAQPAEVSTETSHGFGYFIGECFVQDFNDWSDMEKSDFSAKIDFPIRKCAHASEYAILALLVSLAVTSYGFRYDKAARISFIITFLYASGDEFHQLFVPGRSGKFSDVLIDSAGGFVGCLLFLLFVIIRRRLKSHNKED